MCSTYKGELLITKILKVQGSYKPQCFISFFKLIFQSTGKIQVKLCAVELVFNGHSWEMIRWPLNTVRGYYRKTINSATLRHLMFRILLKNTTYGLILGKNMVQKLLERLFLVLFEWFGFNWPFNTGERKEEKAVWTQRSVMRPHDRGDRLIEVKITVIKEKQTRDFGNRLPLITGATIFMSRTELMILTQQDMKSA